jgi:hypothetical protein
MVNREILALHDTPAGSSILFMTSTHQRLFNIWLVDFLSPTDPDLPVASMSFLDAVERIAQRPAFDIDDSVAALRAATTGCLRWLHSVVPIDVWLPSIDKQVQLDVSRLRYLKMCGNIAKHDPLRLGRVAEQLRKAIIASSINVDRDGALLALDDFFQRFHTDILNYHASTIVALLNNIRWGIHEYLLPEFRRSYTQTDGQSPLYQYTYPDDVIGTFARQRYWALMNDVRAQPILPRFDVVESLKARY